MFTKLKILVTGAKGMLGRDIVNVLSSDYTVIPAGREELDITNEDAVHNFINKIKPHIVINCAAYTNVDGAETNKEEAFLINAAAVKNLASACRSQNIKLIHYSTDYIFDGRKTEAYTEADSPNPISVYGSSKLQGEEYIQSIMDEYLIIRTSWLFGRGGDNFVTKILRASESKKELTIVNDQVGSPTYVLDLAQATLKLISRNAEGIFNVTNRGHCSRYEFAREIFLISNNQEVLLTPITSEKLTYPAKRPNNSMLNGNKFYNFTKFKVPDWQSALRNYLESIRK